MVNNICRCIHNDKYPAAEYYGCKCKHYGKHNTADISVKYIFSKVRRLLCTKALGNRNHESVTDSHTETDYHEVDRTCCSNSGKSFNTESFTNDYCVNKVVELLKQHSEQHWNCESKNMLGRRTVCHVFYHRISSLSYIYKAK